MVLDLHLPQQLAGGRIDGVDGGARVVLPVDAAGGGVERVDGSAGATGEDAASDDCGLRGARGVALECEHPFQLEGGHVGGGEAGLWLIARVGEVGAPSVPIGVAKRERAGGGGALANGGNGGGGEFLSGD